MATDYIMLGQRIGYLRRKNGLSQEELAEKVNLSRESISMIESGKTGIRVNKYDIQKRKQLNYMYEMLHSSESLGAC